MCCQNGVWCDAFQSQMQILFPLCAALGSLLPVLFFTSMENQGLTVLSFPIWRAMNMMRREVKECAQGRCWNMNSAHCLFGAATEAKSVSRSRYLLCFQVRYRLVESYYITLHPSGISISVYKWWWFCRTVMPLFSEWSYWWRLLLLWCTECFLCPYIIITCMRKYI